MKFLLTIFWMMLSLLLIISCDSSKNSIDSNTDFYKDVNGWQVPKPILPDTKKKQYVSRPVIKVINDKIAILYGTPSGIELSYDNKEYIVNSEGGAKRVWLFTDRSSKSIYALWWKKTNKGKKLFFSSSEDFGKSFSKAVVINRNGGVLPHIDLISDGKNVTVAYHDERNPPYRIYVNSSSDNGRTWKEQDIRIDNDEHTIKKKLANGKEIPVNFALNPSLEILKSGLYVVIWEQKKIVGNKYLSQIVSRISRDKGNTWLPETVVYTSHTQDMVEIVSTSIDNRVIVSAAYPQKGILGFVATDKGVVSSQLTWTSIGAIKGTQDVNEISWLKPAVTKDQLKLAYIVQRKASDKYAVEVATFYFNNHNWNDDIFRLDRDKNQPVKTKAGYVDLKPLSNGEFVAVWQDNRSIIPVIMIDYTKNKGKKWVKATELTRAGLSVGRMPELHIKGNTVVVTFEWDILRDKKLPNLVSVNIKVDPSTGGLKVVAAPVPKFSDKEKRQKLKARAEKLLKLKVEDKWVDTWDFMDPVYKVVTNKDSWKRNIGFVSYEKGKVIRVDYEGNFGTAEIEAMVSMKQQLRQGGVVEASPAKKITSTQKWLWFYDDWYFYPSNSFMMHLSY